MLAIHISLILTGLASTLDTKGESSAPVTELSERFQKSFEAASQGRLQVPPEVDRAAQKNRYVFVGGFWNERMRSYFAQNAQELKARGVPRDQIHFIYPSSNQSIDENAEQVRAGFQDIVSAGPEPIVVIAHSRGACDALAFALRNPKFVQQHILALFLVQGPFGGTRLADYIKGEGPAVSQEIPRRYRAVAQIVGQLEKNRLSRGKHLGINGLTRKASREFWDATVKACSSAVPIVGPRTFYITSETPPAQLGLIKRATGLYLSDVSGPNDGVVAREDQSLPELGTVLANIDAGHADLTHRGASTRAPRRQRKALIQGILMTLADIEGLFESQASTTTPIDDAPRDRWFRRTRTTH